MKGIVITIGIIIGIVVIVFGITGFGFLISKQWIPATICLSVFFVVFTVFGIGGIKTVHQEERMVIEFFGSYYGIKKPGLRWVCPFIMTVRAIVSIWEQSLTLFEKPIKIDFEDGSATPKGVEAFVRVEKPDDPYPDPGEQQGQEGSGVYRVIYHVDNWREKTVKLLENAVRSYLATLTIDQALPKRRGGFDLLTANRIPKGEKDRIKKTLEEWGLDLMRITITDFDLESDLVEARGQVHKRRKAVEAANEEKVVRARETVGALVQMIAESTGKKYEDIQKEISGDSELKAKIGDFSKELITRRMSIDGKALIDIRTGGGDLEQSFLRLIAAFKAGARAEIE